MCRIIRCQRATRQSVIFNNKSKLCKKIINFVSWGEVGVRGICFDLYSSAV